MYEGSLILSLIGCIVILFIAVNIFSSSPCNKCTYHDGNHCDKCN